MISHVYYVPSPRTRVSNATESSGRKTLVALKSANLRSKLSELKVQKAIVEKKIFTIIGSGEQFNLMRFLLMNRGWIEKVVQDNKKGKGIRKPRRIKAESLMLQEHPSFLVWLPRNYEKIDIKVASCALRSRITRHPSHDFTRKDGLKQCQDDIHWHILSGTSELSSPRTFTMREDSSRKEWEKEYKFTAFTSFLYFLNVYQDFSSLFSDRGTISSDVIDFALQQVETVLRIQRHEDIDHIDSSQFDKFSREHQEKMFGYFQQRSNAVVRNGEKFKWHTRVSIVKLRMKTQKTLTEVFRHWPERIYDGSRNVWVVKPCEASCGKGVVLMNNHRQILNYVEHQQHECDCIVQKYIERPFLIWATKFDIRQHFVTFIKDRHLTVWFYRDSFLKFSSEKFNMDDFHWSIHLTNNVLQLKHKPGMWNPLLPKDNMWTRDKFLEHLSQTGRREIWDDKIYPTMKRNIVGAVLASLEGTEFRDQSFELNGADFLLACDLKPILLEINSSPNLSFTTSAKRKIGSAIIRDLVNRKKKIHLFVNNSLSDTTFV